jgi:hypothetical protein
MGLLPVLSQSNKGARNRNAGLDSAGGIEERRGDKDAVIREYYRLLPAGHGNRQGTRHGDFMPFDCKRVVSRVGWEPGAVVVDQVGKASRPNAQERFQVPIQYDMAAAHDDDARCDPIQCIGVHDNFS